MTITRTQQEVINRLKASGNHVGVTDHATVVGEQGTLWRVRRVISGSVTRPCTNCEHCGSYQENVVDVEFTFEGTVEHADYGEERWRFKEARARRVSFSSITSTMKALDRFTGFEGHLKPSRVNSVLEGTPYRGDR